MKKILIHLLLSVAIGCVFVWAAIHDVVWADLTAVFSKADLRYAGIYFVLFSFLHVMRTYRWGLLLKPLKEVPFGRLLAVNSVGYMILLVLPFRLGEFARPLLIADRSGIRVSAALGTVVVERVVDAIFMAVLLVCMLFYLHEENRFPREIQAGAWLVLLGLLAGLGALLWILWKRDRAIGWMHGIVSRFSEGLANRLSSFLHAFIDGFQIFPNFKLLLTFLLMTLVFWGLNAAGLLCLFRSFSGMSTLGWPAALTLLSVICIGLMIPAGPVMVGNFHFLVKMSLSFFAAGSLLGSTGLGYAILLHALQVCQQLLFGVVYLFSDDISFRRFLFNPLVKPSPSAT